MIPYKKGKIILILSVLISVLLTAASVVSILSDNFYRKETLNWQVQSAGQDLIDLSFIVPVLLASALFSYRKNKPAMYMWAGVLAYILYTFVIFCFSVHFNNLFLLYCSILGLSFYSLFWFIISQVKEPPIIVARKTYIVTGVTGIYFILLTLIFCALWLSEIIPAINSNSIPSALTSTGLITNPVHVLDLAIFLPAIFISGLFVLTQNPNSFPLTIAVLTFLLLMEVTIAWLGILMYRNAVAANLMVPEIMIGLVILTLIMITWNIDTKKEPEPGQYLDPIILFSAQMIRKPISS